MFAKKILTAGLLTVAAATAGVSTPVLAQGVYFEASVIRGGDHWDRGRDRDWRDEDRRGHRRDWRWDREPARYDYIGPQRVRQILRAKGFQDIRYLDRRGRIYEARATDYRGRRVGLVVSARTGAILNVYR